MNGSSSLAESDRRPLHLCPIDLRKLQWLVGFDVAERYASLHRFWRAADEGPEASWAEQRFLAANALQPAMPILFSR
jgi:archaemetzincin